MEKPLHFDFWTEKRLPNQKKKKRRKEKLKIKLSFDLCPQNSMLGSSLCKNYQAKTSGKESYETAGNVAGLLFIFCLWGSIQV